MPRSTGSGNMRSTYSYCPSVIARPLAPLFRSSNCSSMSVSRVQEDHVRADDLILVSVDDHLVEPPQMFDAHIPAVYRDSAPKVMHQDDGSDVWVFNGAVIPNIGLNA